MDVSCPCCFSGDVLTLALLRDGAISGQQCAVCNCVWKEDRRKPNEKITKLQAFKDFVHKRLDAAGIPTHPDGPHSARGCRIGDRLDIALSNYEPPTVVKQSCPHGFENWDDCVDCRH